MGCVAPSSKTLINNPKYFQTLQKTSLTLLKTKKGIITHSKTPNSCKTIKNSIENPNDAYESSLIQPDLIIRSSKGRLISHQDYTSNNASANHRNHRSMNPSMPLWTQTAIQSNDAPAIGLLSPFDSRVISPDAINTTSRTRAVSGFWFSLQPDDPNHLSQEEVPKPYLRIRYSLDKNVCHSDFFMYVIFNLCANVKQPAIKQWFTQSESFMYVN